MEVDIMPNMKDKPLSAPRQHFCKIYCTNGHNAAQAYKIAYPGTKNGYNAHGSRLIAKDSIKKEISRIEAVQAVKLEHNRELAIKRLTALLLALQPRIEAGEIGAVNAATGIVRELDAISNLHSSTVHTTEDTATTLTPEQAQRYSDMAAQANRDRLRTA